MAGCVQVRDVLDLLGLLTLASCLLRPSSAKYHVFRSRQSAEWVTLGDAFADVITGSAERCKRLCVENESCRSALYHGNRCFLHAGKFCPSCAAQTIDLGVSSTYSLYYNMGPGEMSVAHARNVCLHERMHLIALEEMMESFRIPLLLINVGKCQSTYTSAQAVGVGQGWVWRINGLLNTTSQYSLSNWPPQTADDTLVLEKVDSMINFKVTASTAIPPPVDEDTFSCFICECEG